MISSGDIATFTHLFGEDGDIIYVPLTNTQSHGLSTQHAIAGRKTLGGGRLWYRTDCGTLQIVLLGAVHSHLPARQIFGYKWGAAGWGE